MKTNETKKRRRAKLFKEQGGLCHWCKQPMQLIETNPNGGRRLPPDLCTIDHLRDRFHPARRETCKGEQRLVAACWQCNNDRGRQRQAQISKRTLHRRSGRWPREQREGAS